MKRLLPREIPARMAFVVCQIIAMTFRRQMLKTISQIWESQALVIKRTIAPKSLDRFKQRIRDITRRAKGVSIKATMEELARYMLGWRGYFGFCETPEELIALTRWVRLRLRAAFWRQWKTPRRRRAALIALGVSGQLRNMAGSGRGPWHLARSKALSVGLSNAYFKSLGLPSLIEAR